MSTRRRVLRRDAVAAADAAAPQRFFATCPRGLESLLAEDVVDGGGGDVAMTPGGVSFSGDTAVCYRLNLHSRIATRVLREVAAGPCRNEGEIYRLAHDVAWSRLFNVSRSIRVYVTAVRSRFKSLEYITLKVKDAVCDRFRADVGARPDVNTAAPDIRIHLFMAADKAQLYVDTSGSPLWLRGQKIARVAAPLKENLAAGILRLSGWRPGRALLDPMCGSGTFLLEAAAMALGDAPGLSRDMKDFGFTRLLDYQPALWKQLCCQAAERRAIADELPIFGSDSDADAVARTQQNLAHAGLDDLIRVHCADLTQLSAPQAGGMLVANPPYGERLGEAAALAELYPRIGAALKSGFPGWSCWFISADAALPKRIGLKSSKRLKLYNGALACHLYGYNIDAAPPAAASDADANE